MLNEVLNADDMDQNASSEAKRQRAMEHVSQLRDNYDVTISITKQVVHQPAPGKPYKNKLSV